MKEDDKSQADVMYRGVYAVRHITLNAYGPT